CILLATKKNDTILDMFMGSGTTGIAAIETERNFIGIELDDNSFYIANDRIQKFKINEKEE
ncbi:MAG: site-specific DNA-methyltransferase, partial [Ruminococcus sp.]|nr:site-specific DNA-methyltransferase [Ruminococcus sp.]